MREAAGVVADVVVAVLQQPLRAMLPQRPRPEQQPRRQDVGSVSNV